MHYKQRTKLIAYIDAMLHSCLKGKELTHCIAACPMRAELIPLYLKKYEEKKWLPFDEVDHVNAIEEVKREDRSQLGAIDYAKKSTRN